MRGAGRPGGGPGLTKAVGGRRHELFYLQMGVSERSLHSYKLPQPLPLTVRVSFFLPVPFLFRMFQSQKYLYNNPKMLFVFDTLHSLRSGEWSFPEAVWCDDVTVVLANGMYVSVFLCCLKFSKEIGLRYKIDVFSVHYFYYAPTVYFQLYLL